MAAAPHSCQQRESGALQSWAAPAAWTPQHPLSTALSAALACLDGCNRGEQARTADDSCHTGFSARVRCHSADALRPNRAHRHWLTRQHTGALQPARDDTSCSSLTSSPVMISGKRCTPLALSASMSAGTCVKEGAAAVVNRGCAALASAAQSSHDQHCTLVGSRMDTNSGWNL